MTIALGIGSNAAVYGFVRGFVMPNMPITDIDRVVSLFSRDGQRNLAPLSFQGFLELGPNADLFERLGAARESRIRMTAGPRTLTLAAAAITPDLGDILGLPAGKGVVISDRLRRGELGTMRDLSEVRIHIDGREMPDRWRGSAAARRPLLRTGRRRVAASRGRCDPRSGSPESDLHRDWTSAVRRFDRGRTARVECGWRGGPRRGPPLTTGFLPRRLQGCRG